MLRHSIVLAFAFVTFGCSSSPEKICDHMNKLEDEDRKKDDDKKKDDELDKLIEKIRKARRERCPKEFAALKEDSADVYKCASKCIMDAKDRDDMKKCGKSCDGFKDAYKKASKKVREKDKDKDDDDKDSKKKKSKDDDD